MSDTTESAAGSTSVGERAVAAAETPSVHPAGARLKAIGAENHRICIHLWCVKTIDVRPGVLILCKQQIPGILHSMFSIPVLSITPAPQYHDPKILDIVQYCQYRDPKIPRMY